MVAVWCRGIALRAAPGAVMVVGHLSSAGAAAVPLADWVSVSAAFAAVSIGDDLACRHDAYGGVAMTPLGREMRSLARQIADGTSQMSDLERQQSLRQDLKRKLESAGSTTKEMAKAAGVTRFTVHAWLHQARMGRYPTL